MLSNNIRLPRVITKWLQTVPVVIERGFENGKVFGEILAFYHPDKVDLHRLQSENDINAKRNNFMYLEGVFNEFEIPVTREDCLFVAQGDLKRAIMVLDLIYSHVQGLRFTNIQTFSSVSCLNAIARCFNNLTLDIDVIKVADLITDNYIDNEDLVLRLEGVRNEIVMGIQNESEIDAIFDTFIPAMVEYDAGSPIFQSAATVLIFLGHVLHDTRPARAYNRLRICKEYENLIGIVDSGKLEKIQLLVEVLNAYSGNDEVMTIILEELRSMLKPKGYLYLLTAHSNFKRITTHPNLVAFYLSECIKIMKRTSGSIEKACVMHILRVILQHKSMKSQLLRECIGYALHPFENLPFSETIDPYRKAYVELLLQLSNTNYEQEFNAVRRLGALLQENYDGLHQSLILVSPVLNQFPQLCSIFVESILQSCQSLNELIQLLNREAVTWGIPFVREKVIRPIKNTWNAFGIVMGMLRLLETGKRSELDNKCLTVLKYAVTEIPGKVNDEIYLKLHKYIFSTLGVEETSQEGWDLFLLFIASCSSEIIISVKLCLTRRNLVPYWLF
jgi:CH-like domain in sperm protein